MNRKVYILGCLLFLSLVSSAFGAEYFVSKQGNDASPGTLNEPFLTIEKGTSVLQPGDTLYIREGRYHEYLYKVKWRGSETSRYTIRAYNREKVILDGTVSISDISVGGWTVHQGNIYKIQLTQDIWQLFDNDVVQTSARWPNSFWHDDSIWDQRNWASLDTETQMSQSNHFIDADVDPFSPATDLAASGINATGAMAVLNISNFDTYVEAVTAHTPGTNRFRTTWNEFDTIRHFPKMASGGQGEGTLHDINNFFFLECALSLLDAPTEWFYDKDTKILYYYPMDGRSPQGRDIRGKVQTYFFDFIQSYGIDFKGLDFFATTIRIVGDASYITVEDCDFMYPSYSRRMLKERETAEITQFGRNGSRWLAFYDPSYILIKNCTFQNTDGAGISMHGRYNRIENCLFRKIDYSVVDPSSGDGSKRNEKRQMTFRGNDDTLTVRQSPGIEIYRVTVDTAGSAHNIPGGAHRDAEGDDSSHISYSRVINGGLLQAQDGANFHTWQFDSDYGVLDHNWASGTKKWGFRFDGNYAVNAQYPDNITLNNGAMNYNVAWDMAIPDVYNGRTYTTAASGGFRLGGDYHEFFNNLSVTGDHNRTDLLVKSDDNGNTRSHVNNNLAGSMDGGGGVVYSGLTKNANIAGPGAMEKIDVADHLRDPANLDFRPKAGAILIDKGYMVAGVTTDVVGAAPDIGPYEYGADTYWIPGYQAPHASTPIPPAGAVNAKPDLDLMWLPGYEAQRHDVYFGTAGNLSHIGTFTTKNIVRPDTGDLVTGQTYSWRVDTVDRFGDTITGEVWTFTVGPESTPPPGPTPPPPPAPDGAMIHQYTFNADTRDQIGNAHLTLNGGAGIIGGQLNLPGGGVRASNAAAVGTALTELVTDFINAKAITIETWVTLEADNPEFARVWSAGTDGGGFRHNTYFNIDINRLFLGDSGIAVNAPGRKESLLQSNKLNAGVKYYLAATWDTENNEMIYSIGEPGGELHTVNKSMIFNDFSTMTFEEIYIGSSVGFDDQDLKGQIDELRIWRGILTPETKARHFASGPDGGSSTPPTVTIGSPTGEPTYDNGDNNVITLSGTASDDNGVTSVTWTNQTTGATGTAAGTETWTCADIPLTENDNVIVITATDDEGQTSRDQITVRYTALSAPPSIVISSPTGDPTYDNGNNNVITISGTASDDNGVTSVSWTNQTTGATGTATGTGNWTCTDIPLTANDNIIIVTATDGDGQTGQDQITVRYTALSSPPVVTISNPTGDPTYDNGNNNVITLSGTASDDNGVTSVTWTNQTTGATGTAAGTGNWTCTDIPLAENDNIIIVTATDGDGQTGRDQITVRYSVPLTSPVVSITSPTSDAAYDNGNNSVITLSGTASDDNGIAAVKWTNQTTGESGTAVGTENWICTDIPLAENDNVIVITAVDGGGLTGQDQITVQYSASSLSPVLTINGPTSEDTYDNGNNSVITLSGTASDDGSVAAVKWTNQTTGASGTAVGTGNWTCADIPLVEGDNVIIVTAADDEGLTGHDQITVQYNASSAAPMVTITSPTSEATYSNGKKEEITLSGTASDDNGVAIVRWTNQATGESGTALGTDDWTCTDIPLAVNDNVIVITVEDGDGLTGHDQITVRRTAKETIGDVIDDILNGDMDDINVDACFIDSLW